MKFLKYLFLVLAILILLFVGRGLLTPSIDYTSEISVDKPLKEAWAVMSDPSRAAEWLEGVQEINHVSGEVGTVGAVTEYTFLQSGQESKVIETITSIRPDEQIQMEFDAPGVMDMNYVVDYSEVDGKTNIKSSTVVEGQGFFMKCLIPWIKGTMISQEEKNLANLQKLINENTTNYFPEPTEMTREAVEE